MSSNNPEIVYKYPTVAMVVYNNEVDVVDAIQSVLDQTEQNFELLIVDDGSTDGTVKAIKKFKDKRIRFLPQKKNKGIATVRNICLEEYKGDCLCWVDSDDTIEPEYLEDVVGRLQGNDISFCHLNVNGEIWEYGLRDHFSMVNDMVNLGANVVPNAGMVMTREIIDKSGLFDPDMEVGSDTLFHFQMIRHVREMGYCKKALYNYNWGGKSVSKNIEKRAACRVVLYDKILESDFLTHYPEIEFLVKLKRTIVARGAWEEKVG